LTKPSDVTVSDPPGKHALDDRGIPPAQWMPAGRLAGERHSEHRRRRGEANRNNNYMLEHVHRLKDIPVHIVHGRYDRVCHLYQGEAVVRSLRAMGNEDVNYFITTAGHSSLEPETESRLCTIMNDLPPMSPFDRGGE
jgi:pimeloyl-ACP methyl ester carboxylesterase